MNLTSDWTAKMICNDPAESASIRIVITRLRVQNANSEVAVRISLESGEHREQKDLPLTMEQYCDLRPVKGEISEEQYEALERASELCMALRCGEHLLSYAPSSRLMLTRKIMQRGFSNKIASEAAEKLSEMGLIDEAADVRREVEKCVRKLWGAKRISAHLWSRGFASESLSDLGELLAGVDFSENCARLIEKHYGGVPAEESEHRRMINGLCRYGYSLTEIREACRMLGGR